MPPISFCRKGNQLNLSAEDAVELLSLAGETTGAALGKPGKHPFLRLTLGVGPQQFVWIQGDTNACWLEHQNGRGGEEFLKLQAVLADEESRTINVIGAEFVNLPGKKALRGWNEEWQDAHGVKHEILTFEKDPIANVMTVQHRRANDVDEIEVRGMPPGVRKMVDQQFVEDRQAGKLGDWFEMLQLRIRT